MSADDETNESGVGAWSRGEFLRRSGQFTLAAALSGGVADVFARDAFAAKSARIPRGGTFVTSAASPTGGPQANFNPVLSATNGDRGLESLLFDGLLSWDSHGNLFPRLAAAMPTISKNQLVYTFKLRPNIKWTDGQPLTALDVVYTYVLMADPHYAAVKSAYRGDLVSRLESIHAPNPTTIVFKLREPYAPFLANHGFHGIVPRHILKDLSPADFNNAPFNLSPTVTNGPFKFTDWVHGDHITLSRNEKYYGQVPHLDKIVQIATSSSAAFVNLLQTGGASGGRIADTPSYLQLKASKGLSSLVIPDNGLTDYFYQLDPTKSAAGAIFADKRVRQALVWGLDRKGMAKGLYQGFASVADSIFAPVSWAYNAKTAPKYGYDPEKALALLAAAGWKKNSNGILAKNGQTLKFSITEPVNSLTYTEVAQAMQSNWKALGCDVSLNQVQYAQLLNTAYFTRQFDVIIPGYSFAVDPDPSATFHSRNIIPGGLNAASYKNPTIDKLLDAAVATADQTKRKAMYHKIANLLASDVPMVPLVLSQAFFVYNSHFHGFGPKTIGTFTNVNNLPFMNQVWYKK